VADVIREVHEKMVRRHPHVFGEKRAKDAAEVLRNWEQIKAEERAGAQGRQEHGEIEKKEATEVAAGWCAARLASDDGRFAIDAEGFAGGI